jgi:hypothetical protein
VKDQRRHRNSREHVGNVNIRGRLHGDDHEADIAQLVCQAYIAPTDFMINSACSSFLRPFGR